MRDGTMHANPRADYGFSRGDLVAVIGDAAQLAAFEKIAEKNSE